MRDDLRTANCHALSLPCLVTACALVLLVLPATLGAQDDPPLVGRPPQFSGIVGRYRISASATPTTVTVETPLTLRLTIQGHGPAKYQPDRRLLKLFPERWTAEFYVEPVPAEDRHVAGSDTWEFVYRLRPKNQKANVIDGIKLVYYEPGRNGGRFQTDYAEPIELHVEPRPPAPAPPDSVPIQTAPPSFYELPAPDALLATPPSSRLSPWLLATLFLVPPVLTLAGVCVWRRLYPDAGTRRYRERTDAARRALRALGAEPAWMVLGRYLYERLEFPAAEPTPAEVRRFLRRRGASRAVAEKVAGFLDSCAAARFAPASAGSRSPDLLRHEAGRLIQTLEDDLCA